MTRGFWRDPERYIETYWSRFPGVWTHGDWASVDEDGYWFLHGRSDDTLNIAGKRVGPAELESAAVAHPAGRSGRRGCAARCEGRGRVALLRARPRARRRRGARVGRGSARREGPGKAFRPERVLFVPAAEDAERQDRTPSRAREGARPRPGRPVVAGEPRGTGGDRKCRLSSKARLHSSPAAAAASAPTSHGS